MNTVIVPEYSGYTMTPSLDMIVIALLLLNLTISLFFFRKIAQIVIISSNKLSNDTAEALQAVVQQIVEGDFELPNIEPPNMFQQMVMEMIQNKMKPPSLQVTEIQTRSDDGTFA